MKNYDVVIVNYNGEKIISDCLKSIRNSTLQPQKIIIYDNNSSDRSVEIILKNFPEVELIQGKKNLGFASGNNLAMDQSRSDYILFMNNDLIIEKDCARELLEYIIESEVALANPLIFKGWDIKKNPEVYSFGAQMNSSAFGYSLFDLGEPREDLSCFSGACFMAQAKTIKKLKFESSFFLYYEEPDLSAKLLSNGFKIGRTNKAVCYHLESHSSPQKERQGICFRQYFAIQNRWFILGKYFNNKQFLRALPLNIIHLLYNGLFFISSRDFKKIDLVFKVTSSFNRGRKFRKNNADYSWLAQLEPSNLKTVSNLKRKVYKST